MSVCFFYNEAKSEAEQVENKANNKVKQAENEAKNKVKQAEADVESARSTAEQELNDSINSYKEKIKELEQQISSLQPQGKELSQGGPIKKETYSGEYIVFTTSGTKSSGSTQVITGQKQCLQNPIN